MAISRPFLLAVLGVLLMAVTVVAVTSARSGSDSDTEPAVLQTEQAPAQSTSSASPVDTVRSAMSFTGVESAAVDARVVLSDKDDTLRVGVSGAFERGAANDVPEFAIDVRMADARQSARLGLVSLGDRAYFTRGDTGWRMPEQAWDMVGAAVGNGWTPIEIHPATWVKDAKSEGSETVDGVEAERYTVTLDPKAVVPDVARSLRSNDVDVKTTNKVVRSVEQTRFEVWVGKDDNHLRRLDGAMTFSDGSRITLHADVTGVNEPQQIEAPERVRAGAPGGILGQFASGAVKGATGGISLDVLTSPNPRRVARAVREHRKVVILFRNPRGLDDRAMGPVIRAVDGRTKALVVTDHVDAVDRYGKLVEDLGVSQTPSVVIIDSSGEAQLLEGYVDSESLAQAVADAR